MGPHIDKLKRHIGFTKKEVIGLAIVTVIIGFFYSFRNWGIEEGVVDIEYGLSILIMSCLIFAFCYVIRLLVQRAIAITLGYQPIFEFTPIAWIISLMVVVLTNGVVAPAMPGWQTYDVIKRYRLGKWPQDYNVIPLSWNAAVGLYIHVFFAMIGNIFVSFMPGIFWDKFVIINLGLAIFGLIPIPYNDGFHIIFSSSHLAYIFTSILVVTASLLIVLNAPLLIAIIIPAILGAIGVGIYVWNSKDYKSH